MYQQGQREKATSIYAILDDQSNRLLVCSDFFELFNIKSPWFPYRLKTCAGPLETSGRKAKGFQVESLDGKMVLSLPPLIECNEILNDRSEIPTPDAARCHPHLRKIAQYIPELDPQSRNPDPTGERHSESSQGPSAGQRSPQRSFCPETGPGMGPDWRRMSGKCTQANRKHIQNHGVGKWPSYLYTLQQQHQAN